MQSIGTCLGALVIICLFAGGLPLEGAEGARAAQGDCCPKAEKEKIASKWGLEITALRLSAGGRIIDFRYRVLNPDKAALLADGSVKPVLIDNETGTRLHVPTMPKVGQLRSTTQRMQAGKIYTALFSNGSGVVRTGSKVTVVFGDFRAEDITVSE